MLLNRGEVHGASEDLLLTVAPAALTTPSTNWTFNAFWQQRRIGGRDFYWAAQGSYIWTSETNLAAYRRVGLLGRMIPGHMSAYQGLQSFDPRVTKTLPPLGRDLVQAFLTNRWPIHSYQYCACKGNPPASPAAINVIADQWLGDGDSESPYRLEPIFFYIRQGKLWQGSSMDRWTEDAGRKFFEGRFFPLLDQALPFYRDVQHAWTRREVRVLSDLYCDEFYRQEGRVMPWGMWLSPFHVAAQSNVVAVAEKGADAFTNARGRGMMRQTGGNKFYLVWRGHEPLERYGYSERAWFSTRGDDWGYPLPHLWYYIFRPYLVGANCYVNEMNAFPVRDVAGDGNPELSTTGLILKDMLDFVDRFPDRGVTYAPVGLMLDVDRGRLTQEPGQNFLGFRLPVRDDADDMNEGLFGEVLFPEHRHTRGTGGYSRTAPFGEIFDLLQPNLPGQTIASEALANYRVLIALGGLQIDPILITRLTDHVRAGGTLVVNAEDVRNSLGEEFLGLRLLEQTETGTETVCLLDGARFVEAPFTYRQVELVSADVLLTTGQAPLVTRHRHGQGQVVVICARYAVAQQGATNQNPRTRRAQSRKPLLAFVPHLLEHIVAGVTPIEVRRRLTDQPDLSWIINRKGDGWVVILFNYSLKRQELVVNSGGTGKVTAEYPYLELPFEIICRAPVVDVIERYGDRDVNWQRRDGAAVISETIHGGEIRVYELQPRPIELGLRERYVNYALGRSVKASSTRDGYPASQAVDGIEDMGNYWWSDSDRRRNNTFTMPQDLEVDLGSTRLIDHIKVKFHCSPYDSLETRLRVYKYVLETSLNGKTWSVVLDKSRNEDPARLEGTEQWFVPTQARHVRLQVLRNSALEGARLVEFSVMGVEKETYPAKRQAILSNAHTQ